MNRKILTAKVDIKTTREYIQYCQLYRNVAFGIQDIVPIQKELTTTPSIEKKKELLVRLAHSNVLEAYGVIKQYQKHCAKNLKSWVQLALNECTVVLKSSVIEEDQMMISSPAGGRGDLLRYYIVLHSNQHNTFLKNQLTKLQKRMQQIDATLSFELEEINCQSRYILCTCLISFDDAPDTIIQKIISYCNEPEVIVCDSYYLTNVQKPIAKQLNNYIDSISNSIRHV